MPLAQAGISVCNDGNVSQLDVEDRIPGGNGPFYRIEVYRSSQPSGGYGVTLSGSRVEHICGVDHLTPKSNQVFRYTFSVGTADGNRSDVPTLLEGREEFNPNGMPDGSWDVRIRDLDPSSSTYGSIIHASAAPNGQPKGYDIQYSLLRADAATNKVAISSPLPKLIVDLNPDLPDLANDLDGLATRIEVMSSGIQKRETPPTILSLNATIQSSHVEHGIADILAALSHPDFSRFRHNLDLYEAFGDFGAKPTHPGTNLIGPNAALAAESIFVRQYRAALVLLGRVVSPDMVRGAGQPLSLAQARTNTRPGVYAIFVGAAINHIGIYKLGLDKVHSDYGGVPMKIAPGSRLEDDSVPVADAWRCNQTLGEIADTYYLANPPSVY